MKNQTVIDNVPRGAADRVVAKQRRGAIACYLLLAAGAFFTVALLSDDSGPGALLALVPWAFMIYGRGPVYEESTWVHSHITWQLKTFTGALLYIWVAFLAMVAHLSVVAIAVVVLGVLWFIYRIGRGLNAILRSVPMYREE